MPPAWRERPRGAKAAEGFWILEEGNDFLKFEFRFIVLESDFRVGFVEDFRARFANGHKAAETLPAGKFAEEEKPKEIENNGGNRPGQDGGDRILDDQAALEKV